MCERLERHRFFLLVLVGYSILGFAYSLVNPLFESPDEALNYANIRYLVEQHRLPVLEPGELTKAHHPPLYYILGALFTFWVPNERFEAVVERINPFWAYRPWEPGVDNKSLYLHNPRLEGFPYRDVALGVHMVRWLSLLMGAGTVLCVYGTARELVGDHKGRPYVAVGAAALAAFNPMFVFITTSVHDDALANLVAAATLYVTARLLVRGSTVWRVIALGLLVGLGFLTKLTCLLVVPTVGLALLWRPLADRGRAGWREAVCLGGTVLGLALLVGGWWFARNLLLYGEPTSMVHQTGVWGVRENAPDLAAAVRELGFLHDTLWGVFGYGQIPMPHWVYGLARLLGLMAAGGLTLFWLRLRSGRIPWERPCQRMRPMAVLLILASGPLVAFAVNFARMTVSAAADFGRYLFVTLATLASLYALGLSEWVPTLWRAKMSIALTLGMVALAVYGLVGVLAPAYAPLPRYGSPEDVAPQHPLDVTYPELAHLLGYDIAPDPLYPGDTLQVTLYWQALEAMDTDYDYVLFLQAFGREGDKIGERDTHPGLGRYPTSRWRAGEVVADTVPVPLTADALAPAALRLDLGLYPPGGPRLDTADGRDTVSVGPVRLASREQAIPAGVPIACRLGAGVRLVAWDPEWDGPIRSGETLRFTLYWACDTPPVQALNVFVHLVGEDGEPLAQGDGPPLDGDYPTDLWVAGDLLADPRGVMLPEGLSPGRYTLLVGLYNLHTGERLPAFDEQGIRLPSDAVPLGMVEVQ